LTTTILTAVVLGAMAGLAPGPYTTMVAGTALERGFKAGFLLALTPLITDVVPMLVSALVLDRLSGMALTLLGITGGAIILVVGARFLRGHRPPGSISEGGAQGSGGHQRRQSARISHVIASTLLNPAPWLFWLIIASPLLLRSWNRSQGEGALFVILLFLTNITTASLLAWLASHGRRVMNPNWQRRTLKGVGVVLILAGAFLCWQATIGNFQSLIDQQEAIRNVVEEGLSTG
jgi:threonine/homoserine/homoserine lactone efflux protein